MPGQVFLLIGLVAGSLLAAQGPINARLAGHLGGPVPAAVISFAVGLVALLVATALFRQPVPHAGTLQSAPWWAFLGGLAGACAVTGAAFAVPHIGVASWIAVIIAGQLVGAMLIDHFGALGTAVRPIGLERLLGVGLLALGIWFIHRGGR